MPHYRMEVHVEAEMDEAAFAEWAERVMDAAVFAERNEVQVHDLHVYEIGYHPSYADQERLALRAQWKPLPL